MQNLERVIKDQETLYVRRIVSAYKTHKHSSVAFCLFNGLSGIDCKYCEYVFILPQARQKYIACLKTMVGKLRFVLK